MKKMTTYALRKKVMIAVTAFSLLAAPAPAYAQFPTFDIASCVGTVGKLIAKVMVLLQVPMRMAEVNDIRNKIGDAKEKIEQAKAMVDAVKSGDTQAIMKLAGKAMEAASKAREASVRETEAVKVAEGGQNEAQDYFTDAYYLEALGSDASPSKSERERRVELTKQVRANRNTNFKAATANAYATALAQKKIVSDNKENMLSELRDDSGGASTVLDALKSNSVASLTAAEQILPLLAMEIAKLEMESAQIIRDDPSVICDGCN